MTFQKDLPVGTIMAYTGHEGSLKNNEQWKICNGEKLSKKDYPELHTVLANYWEEETGARNKFFAIPDLRGLFLRGVNGGRTDEFSDPDEKNRTSSANKSNSVGSLQQDELESHVHSITSKAANGPYAVQSSGFAWGDDNVDGRKWSQNSDMSGGKETRPKNAYVHWIIKIK